jgi:DNA-binding response OmpR family regulator
MTALSAASTFGETWNRLPHYKNEFDPQPMPVGTKFSPPSLAQLDLPQGKVLLVVDDAVLSLDLQRVLRDAGYRAVGPAATVDEVQRMLQRGDIDCAILDLEIDRRMPLPIADLLGFADVPFVYLTRGVLASVPSRHRHRPVIQKPFNSDVLISAVEKAMARRRVANDNPWATGGTVVPWERVYPSL